MGLGREDLIKQVQACVYCVMSMKMSHLFLSAVTKYSLGNPHYNSIVSQLGAHEVIPSPPSPVILLSWTNSLKLFDRWNQRSLENGTNCFYGGKEKQQI